MLSVAPDLRWITLRAPNQTTEMWYGELTNTLRCDEVAICELLLLAQLSDDGYVAANCIINKLFKSKSDNEPIGNPSAFVHSSVNNASYHLEGRPFNINL